MASQVLGIAWADSVESQCCDGGAGLAGDDIRQHNRFAATDPAAENTGHTWRIPSATNAIKVNIETSQRYQETFRITMTAELLLGLLIVQRHCFMKSFIRFCNERVTHLHISLLRRDPSNKDRYE